MWTRAWAQTHTQRVKSHWLSPRLPDILAKGSLKGIHWVTGYLSFIHFTAGEGSPTALQGKTMSFIHGVVTVPLKVRIRAGATTPKSRLSIQSQGDLPNRVAPQSQSTLQLLVLVSDGCLIRGFPCKGIFTDESSPLRHLFLLLTKY